MECFLYLFLMFYLTIMSRLPIRSLSKCRLVCKSWYDLIKNPNFAKIQFEWAVKNNSPCVFFWSREKDFYMIDDQVFDRLETSATAQSLELNEFEQVFPDSDFKIAGFVNGLICFAPISNGYDPCSFYVCNPIIGEHITIPKSPINIYSPTAGEHITIPKPAEYRVIELSAFGFSPSTNEYKVIRLLKYFDKRSDYLTSECEVYTLGSSEWRKIADVPIITDTMQCAVLSNGNVHWKSYVSDSCVIVAFSVGAEKFNVIQLPTMLQTDDSYKCLEVVEEQLCCICMGDPCNSYDMWVMEDYGDNSSWVKKYSLSWDMMISFWHGPTLKLRNDEFLLHNRTENEVMVYFDPKRKTSRSIRVNQIKEHCYQSVIQVGSLFSPKDVDKPTRGNV